MTDRYDSMIRLRDHMEELFQFCGVQTQDIHVNLSPMPIRIVEKIVKDEALHSYLDSLDHQAEQAIQKMKDQQLERWNNEQNEIRLQELEQELEGKNSYIQGLEQKLEQKNHPEPVEEKRIVQKEADNRPENGKYEMIQDIIAMRDRLLLQKSWAKDVGTGEENAVKVIDGQLKETAKCLKKAGVEILESGDVFDSQYQTVVETRTAEMPEQVDRIAETFRPGYRLQDEILRPQEVILFVKGQS